jgi:hypothetical protein
VILPEHCEEYHSTKLIVVCDSGIPYKITKSATTGRTRTAKMMLFVQNLYIAYDESSITINWTAPNGTLRREVVYASKPSPLRMRGPNM